MTWSIDLHFPEYDCEQRFGEGFRSFAYHRGDKRPYPVPYRTLYARDCDNLFLGGRILSMTHVAFSSARVMRTLGQLGEVVGLAAKVARDHDALPRDVYERYLPELIEAMKRGCNRPMRSSATSVRRKRITLKTQAGFTPMRMRTTIPIR